MRIGIVLRVLWPSGASKMAIEETRCLNKLGQKTTLVIAKTIGNYIYKYEDLLKDVPYQLVVKNFHKKLNEAINTPLYFLTPNFRGKESIVDIPSIMSTSSAILKGNFNYILCHDQLTGIAGYFVFRAYGLRYFVYVHDPISTSVSNLRLSKLLGAQMIIFRLSSKLEEVVLKNSSHIIVNSFRTFRSLKSLFDFINMDNTSVIYPGCTPVKNLALNKDRIVLAVSRWDAGRNPDFLLELAERINAKFVMAGSWTPPLLEKNFRREVKNRKLSDKLFLKSSISEEELSQLYLKAGVCIHWVYEGFGMSVLEAMAHGCPVITVRGTGASEIVQNGVQGFVAKKSEAEEYASYVNALLSDKTLSSKMGLEAWRTSELYSWEKHAQRLREIFELKKSYAS